MQSLFPTVQRGTKQNCPKKSCVLTDMTENYILKTIFNRLSQLSEARVNLNFFRLAPKSWRRDLSGVSWMKTRV